MIKLTHRNMLGCSAASAQSETRINEAKVTKNPQKSEAKIINSPKEAINTEGPEVNAISDTKTFDINQIKEVWSDLIAELSKIKMSLATYLQEGWLYKVECSLLTVAFNRSASLHKEVLENKDNRKLVENILNALLKSDLRIGYTTLDTQECTSKEKREDESFIKSALDTFRGKVFRRD